MNERRYLVITVEDAKQILEALRGAPIDTGGIRERLARDTGADVEEIVSDLKGLSLCHACVFEGQETYCSSLLAQKTGRRLGRLLERARGERG